MYSRVVFVQYENQQATPTPKSVALIPEYGKGGQAKPSLLVWHLDVKYISIFIDVRTRG